ncbi:hypothetical protein TCDM_12078 [Trypanosoma cruzi Dm28c]|uniref:Reverse transcriptase domain-containing protein n=2 Tax=Trypanosoma cruzi TaxID=5693 RepID=V5B7P1_TRYCR|nr:hypothetical protein TCDM_12078 [Trypanosoma cruzi Dm28c]PWU91874.1 hypothetical protein C4B63_41g68 [Trypanosoma cruzi]
MLLEARVEKLGASPSPRWQYFHGVAAPHPHPLESVVLRTELGRVCALPRQQANLLVRHFVRFHVSHYIIQLLLPHSIGSWETDRPLTPYEFEMTIRDSLLGSAPGPDNMLNEFLHRLGPVARGTLRTMIHNSFANGSLPGSWKMGDAIPIPKPGKDPCRPESYRTITLLSVLPKLAEGMIHRRLSALLPHHPRQLRICTPTSCVGRGGTFYRQITRGLNEFGIVEYERPGDDAPTRRPRRHRSWS